MPKATSAPPHAGTTGMSMYIIWCYIELLNHIKCKMSKWSQMHLVLDIRQFACIIVNYGSNMHVWSNYGAFCPCSPVSRNGRTFQLSSSPSHWAIEDNLAAGSVRWRLAKNSTKALKRHCNSTGMQTYLLRPEFLPAMPVHCWCISIWKHVSTKKHDGCLVNGSNKTGFITAFGCCCRCIFMPRIWSELGTYELNGCIFNSFQARNYSSFEDLYSGGRWKKQPSLNNKASWKHPNTVAVSLYQVSEEVPRHLWSTLRA